MKVIEHLQQAREPLISFEIVPPQRGSDFARLEQTVAELAVFHPPFIDVTSHAARIDGRRKRPGTGGICTVIQHKYQIDAVPHVVCHGFTRKETEDFLIDLNGSGIQNVLALRGDAVEPHQLSPGQSRNEYAVDLVQQVAALNQGICVDILDVTVPTQFCIGVAGYPEKHHEARNMHADLHYLREKVRAGADYIVTQMFFDNRHYFDFVKKCRNYGIDVPIIPGLKILTASEQLASIPNTFYVEIPPALSQPVYDAKDKKEVREIGIQWAVKQAEELFNHQVPAVHFYVMGNSGPVSEVIGRLR